MICFGLENPLNPRRMTILDEDDDRRPVLGLLLTILGILGLVFGGCGGWPQARLDAYLGQQPALDLSGFADLPGVVQTGLVVINDTTAPDSAPKLSDASFDALAEHVRQQLMHAVPLEVVRVVHSSNPATSFPNFATVLQWGKDQHVDYLVMAVLSSSEIEVPERLPWRGSTLGAIGRGLLLGYRAENLALAELALIDVRYRPRVGAESRGTPGLPWTGWTCPLNPTSTRWFDGTRRIRLFTLKRKKMLTTSCERSPAMMP